MKNVSESREMAVLISSAAKLNPFAELLGAKRIALVYQEAFGGEPWNEGFICPVCKTSRALDDKMPLYCVHCKKNDGRLVKILEYWSVDKILSDFYQEMLRPGAICTVKRDGLKITAFAWGYEVENNASLDEHLEAPGLCNAVGDEFLYLDECAVIPEWQGRGCGSWVLKNFMHEASKVGRDVLLRTMKNSVMHKLVVKFGGKVVQDISCGRVIMKIDTNSIFK